MIVRAKKAAAIDTRVKSTVTVTMYNMSEQMHNGYQFAPVSAAGLHKTKAALNAQRTTDTRNGKPEYAGGFPKERPSEAPQFILDYWDFYMSPDRGYIDRAPACSTGWTKTTPLAFKTHRLTLSFERSRLPCCSFMVKRLIHAISARRLLSD